MGVQNATARKLAVPDLTTTVLTLTITGIAADSTIAGKGASAGRRFISVVAMPVGALVGAVFVVHGTVVLPLVIALVLLVFVAATGHLRGRADAPWIHP